MDCFSTIGIMSGTSLDGVDLVFCEFIRENNKWSFETGPAITIPYTSEWIDRLSGARLLDAENMIRLHFEYGYFIGDLVSGFIEKYKLEVDFLASHGHTVFHQPQKKMTWQLGHGSAISAASGILTVADFRSLDVALGGEGAPLVPIGDHMLFNEYDYCLNLGGFANISYEENDKRLAFDICPANIVLNFLTQKMGIPFFDIVVASCPEICSTQVLSRSSIAML